MHIYNRCVEGVEIYFLIYSLFYTLPHAIWISTRVGDYHMTLTIAVRTYAGTSRRRTHDIIKNKEQNSSVFIAFVVRTGFEPVCGVLFYYQLPTAVIQILASTNSATRLYCSLKTIPTRWTRKWGDVVSTYIGGAAKAFIRKAHTVIFCRVIKLPIRLRYLASRYRYRA